MLRQYVIPAALFMLIVQTGCVTARKMDKYVSNQYGKSITAKKIKSDYLTIHSPLITDDPTPSVSSKQTKKMLPLLLYWKIYYQTTCTLNSKIPINQFSTALSSYANAKGLKKKLNGSALELTVTKVPRNFSFNYDYTVLILVYWGKIYLLPEKEEMVLSYKVISNGLETKQGEMTIPGLDQIKGTRYFQSVRSATGEYLARFDENMKTMARSVVDRLMDEL